MSTFINPTVVIIEPIKCKNFGYFTVIEKDNPNELRIRAKSASGKSRGVVGKIYNDGQISTTDKKVIKFITPSVKQKIDLVLELVYKSGNPSMNKNGLMNFSPR